MVLLVTDVYEFEEIIGEYVDFLYIKLYCKKWCINLFCRGSFSNVVLATHNESQNKYAIKVLQCKINCWLDIDCVGQIIDKAKIITDVQRERADREIAILKMCNHPNIVKLVETFESDDEISLVMELYAF